MPIMPPPITITSQIFFTSPIVNADRFGTMESSRGYRRWYEELKKLRAVLLFSFANRGRLLRLSGCGWRIGCQLREHNQSLGRRADIVSRVAGDQRKFRVRGSFDHRDVIRLNYPLPNYFVVVLLTIALHDDYVTFVQLVNVAEESVPMGGNHRIAVLARSRGLIHVAGTE